MAKTAKKTTRKKPVPTRTSGAAGKSPARKPSRKPGRNVASKARASTSVPAKTTKSAARAPANSRKKVASPPSKSPARSAKPARPAAKSGRSTSKAAKAVRSSTKVAAPKRPAAKPVKATTRARARVVDAKSAKKIVKAPAKTESKSTKTVSSTPPAKRRRPAKPALDVKMPTVGTAGRPAVTSGLSFLSGKPGSSGPTTQALDDKPRLSKSKLSPRELAKFREALLIKRRQLLGDMEGMEREALQSEVTNLSHLPVHMADMGTDVYEQEFTLSLVDRDRKIVDEIDHALYKIEKKTFGICEGTGQMIAKTRLEAQPWTRHSIEYARHRQRPGIRREE